MGKFKNLLIAVFAVVILAFGSYTVLGGTISGTGWSQGDVVTFLTNCLTMGNEQKADHNVVLNSYSTTRAMTNEAKTDMNNILASYSTTRAMVNALKTAHNNTLASYSTTRANYNSLQTKYNLLFANTSALNYLAGRTGGFATYTGTQKIIMGNQRSTVNGDATILTSNRTTAASDSTAIATSRVTSASDTTVVTGARTTTTDLTLTIP